MKIIRMSTVGLSLDIFCRGLLGELSSEGCGDEPHHIPAL